MNSLSLAVGVLRSMAKWLSPLVDECMDRLRRYHAVGETAFIPGAKLVAVVCAHMRVVFLEHRKALKNNVEYCRRLCMDLHHIYQCIGMHMVWWMREKWLL